MRRHKATLALVTFLLAIIPAGIPAIPFAGAADGQRESDGPQTTVGIVVFEGVELLDFSGPGEVLTAAGCRVFTVAETKDTIVSQGFLNIVPNHSIDDCPPLDLLVIPGGSVRKVTRSEPMMEWLGLRARELVEKETLPGQPNNVLSVCNGALVLAKIGVLDGLEATTHHSAMNSLRESAPNTTVHDDRRFVDNGKIVTAAGVSAGIDAALHFVARRDGIETAHKVARYMEYTWDPGLTETTLSAAKAAESSPTTPLPLAIGGLDPVRLIEGQELPGDEDLVADDGRYRYLFSSEASRATFQSSTARYGIQARGSCAGMGKDLREGSGKPHLFAVHDGYLYLFAGEHCKEDFTGAPEAFVAEMQTAAKNLWGESVGRDGSSR